MNEKYPPLYSPEWWDARVKVLREAFPKGLDGESRARLTKATLGKDATPALEFQCEKSYADAWRFDPDDLPF